MTKLQDCYTTCKIKKKLAIVDLLKIWIVTINFCVNLLSKTKKSYFESTNIKIFDDNKKLWKRNLVIHG